MTFLQAVLLGFQRFFDFTGRASRAEFWYWCLFWFLGVFFLYIFAILYGSWFDPALKYTKSFLNFLGFWSIVLECVVIIPIAFRRLHDLNKSGWYSILWYMVGALALMALTLIVHDFELLVLRIPFFAQLSLLLVIGLGFLGPVIWMLVWFCKKGDEGDNRFGANPLVKSE